MKHIETSKQSKRGIASQDDTLPFTKTRRIPTLKNRVLAADQRHENAFRHEAEVDHDPWVSEGPLLVADHSVLSHYIVTFYFLEVSNSWQYL